MIDKKEPTSRWFFRFFEWDSLILWI